jgi:hypothetical protein
MPYQFWIFVISTPVALIGLVFTVSGGPVIPTILGSLGLLIGAVLFSAMVWQVWATESKPLPG